MTNRNLHRSVRAIGWGCGLLFVAVLSGCPEMGLDGAADDAPSAAALFTRVTETDPFDQWGHFSDVDDPLESAPPHGPQSRVFINDVVAAALSDFTGQLPADSIIVKQNIGEDTAVTEAALTIMWKVPGFDPDNNDWFWANISLGGDVRAEGQIDGCIACHGAVRSNDFVFVHQFE